MRVFLLSLGLALGLSTASSAQVETPDNYADAMRWYERSAAAGSAPAQFYLGLMHETGTNRNADYVQAPRWFRKAARQGHKLAQYRLATIYHFGRGIPVNFKQAHYWYRKAANQGIAEAAFNLGFLFENGFGATGDAAQAVNWYRQAAEAGLSSAQLYLGALYANGKMGVEKDLVQGWVWIDTAAKGGETSAVKLRDGLAVQMSEEQLKRAHKIAEINSNPKKIQTESEQKSR